MRSLSEPDCPTRQTFEICVDSISNSDLQGRLTTIINEIQAADSDYRQRAIDKELYLTPQNNIGNDDVVVGGVTKKELSNLYTHHMVPKLKPARSIYNKLISNAPFGKCPFCGFGLASTLDHYLPKTKYPLVTVCSLNLVPSCKDCNTGKGTAIARTEGEQYLHPYFDHGKFIDEQWLFAEVSETEPAGISFYAQPPELWDDISKNRVRSHFKSFKLNTRYALEASEKMASLRYILSSIASNQVKNHLKNESESYHINSWQRAVLQSLSDSDWYCNGGFQ